MKKHLAWLSLVLLVGCSEKLPTDTNTVEEKGILTFVRSDSVTVQVSVPTNKLLQGLQESISLGDIKALWWGSHFQGWPAVKVSFNASNTNTTVGGVKADDDGFVTGNLCAETGAGYVYFKLENWKTNPSGGIVTDQNTGWPIISFDISDIP